MGSNVMMNMNLMATPNLSNGAKLSNHSTEDFAASHV